MKNIELFESIFKHSFYKIKLIAVASNIVEKILVFDIHNELYLLISNLSEINFEKLNSTKNLHNLLDNYMDYEVGSTEVIRKEDDDMLYNSNLFSISNNNMINTKTFRILNEKATKDEVVSHISTIFYERDQLFSDLIDNIKIICK